MRTDRRPAHQRRSHSETPQATTACTAASPTRRRRTVAASAALPRRRRRRSRGPDRCPAKRNRSRSPAARPTGSGRMPRPSDSASSPQPRKLGWRHRLVFALTVTDAGLIVVALLVAQLVRFQTSGFGAATPQTDLDYLSLSAAIAAVWLVALSATRSRLLRNIGTGTVEYQRVVNATLITFGDPRRGGVHAADRDRAGVPRGRAPARHRAAGERPRSSGAACCTRCAASAGARRARSSWGGPTTSLRVVDELRRNYRVGYRAIGATLAGSARNAECPRHRPPDGGLRRPRRHLEAHPHACGDRRGRPARRERHDPAPRLGARELEHRADPRVAPDRRGGPPDPPAADQRAADGARRPAAVLGLQPRREADVRRRRRGHRRRAAQPALRGHRHRGPPLERRTGVLPAAARRCARHALHDAEVPVDGDGCRGATRRAPGARRGQRRALQDEGRPARDAVRPQPATVLARRAARSCGTSSSAT